MSKNPDVRGVGNYRMKDVSVEGIDGDFVRLGRAPEKLDMEAIEAKNIGGNFLYVGDGDYSEDQIEKFRSELRKISKKIDDVGDFLLGEAIKTATKSGSFDDFRSRLGKYVEAPALAANLVTIWNWVSSLLPK